MFHHEAENPEFGEGIYHYMSSFKFWAELENLRELLKPLNESLKMSESHHMNLSMIVTRWDSIHTHLERMITTELPELGEFLCRDPQGINDGPFALRYKHQVKPIHIIAFYLIPTNHQVSLDPGTTTTVYTFFDWYSDSPEVAKVMRTEFLHFRRQTEEFGSGNYCWEHADDVHDFWLMQTEHTQLLAAVAVRLFSTPANSAPSEQAFSVQNLLQDKKRDRLHPERVNKLSYIHMNTRVLRKAKVQAINNKEITEHVQRVLELSKDQEVELEEMLMDAARESDNDAEEYEDDSEEGD